jgi:predicted Zn-dependent peptidase
MTKASLNREHICLAQSGVSAQDPRRFAASLLAIIVGDDLGSRLYWELVDKAIAEAASMHFGPMDGTGLFDTYLRCSSANMPLVMEIVGRIFAELVEKGVTQDELVKARNKVLSALVIKNELPMGRLVDLGFNWVYLQEYRSIEADVEAVNAVTVADINTLIRQLNLGHYTQYYLGPVTA